MEKLPQIDLYWARIASDGTQPHLGGSSRVGMTMAVFPRSAHAALPLVLAVLAGCGGSDFGTVGDDTLNSTLESIRSDVGVPAVGALLVYQGRVIETGAVGLRATGHDAQVTVNDQWHLGSLTKAMTATLAGVLVEDGTLSWDMTVGAVFPDMASTMRSEYVDVRLDELMYHTSGLPNDVFSGTPIWPTLRTSTDPLPVQRRQWVSEMLILAPEVSRGTHLYTNGGYMVAGTMIEEITGETWEALMQREVFDALGMTSTGFGPPGTSTTTPDQPWGHLAAGNGLPPTVAADNPAALGPAGTVHTTFQDYALYMAAHWPGRGGLAVWCRPRHLRNFTPPLQARATRWDGGSRSRAGQTVLRSTTTAATRPGLRRYG